MKQGVDLELVVKLIQKSLEPDAIVEHNKLLPVIGSRSGKKRQCDVVITSGPAHRKTITIVEVQDRSSKIDINTFDGWMAKLDAIGAQHLICVSRFDYPESIKEKAFLSGNKVKLINLKDTTPSEIPQSFFKSNLKHIYYTIVKMSSPHIIFSVDEARSLGIYEPIKTLLSTKNFGRDDKIFSLDKCVLKSIFNLCQDSNKNIDINGSGTDTLEYNLDHGQPLFFHFEDKFTRISMKLDFEWKNEVHEYPLSILSYEQQGDGSLAWIFEVQYNTCDGQVKIKAPFIKRDNYYEIQGIVSNLPTERNFTVEIEKITEENT